MKLTSNLFLSIDILVKSANLICTLVFEECQYFWVLDVHGLWISVPLPSENSASTGAILLRQYEISKI